jgi:hypothetical protein
MIYLQNNIFVFNLEETIKLPFLKKYKLKIK